MPTMTQAPRLSDLVKYEDDDINYSRDQITLAVGNNLQLGAVLGMIAASGKYAEFDATASDGTQVARAVLVVPTDATAADVETAALKRFAVVSKQHLVWKTGTTAGKILTALASLEDRGIIARAAV